MSLRLLATSSAAVGIAVGTIVCGIALDHNPQGEFHDTLTGVVDWPDLLTLGGIASIVATVVALPFAAIIVIAMRHRRRPAGELPKTTEAV